jgi:site-specific DNA recombinase
MTITRIPATRKYGKQKIAVYCRVSTCREEQEDSLEIQREYYTSLIATRSDWTLVGVYADNRSGLSADKRPQFLQMINDCLDGKIDRVLCKSISRFSRNAVECRRYIDLLRMRSIAVEFEKENIKTDDQTGTFILSLMSVVAESESRSISENIKMGYKYRFQRGQYNLGNNRILGYDTVDGKLVPNEDAWIVKLIFEEYVKGKRIPEIGKELGEKGIKTRFGNIPSFNVIKRVLLNETYKGDKELWKTPPIDLFTKKPDLSVKRDSIYLKADHESIVDEETWNKAQELLKRKKELYRKIGQLGGRTNTLYGIIFCGNCGAPMSLKTYTSSKGEKHKAWICRNRLHKKGEDKCHMDIVKDDELKAQIADKLGWQTFDEERFLREVCQVIVEGKDLTIEMN